MSGARDFVAGLARAGKSYVEIKTTVDSAFGDKTLSKASIYKIVKKVKAGKNTSDQRHLNAKKTKWTKPLVASVAADIASNAPANIKDLALAHGVSCGTIVNILHEDLGLIKKSARWVPKLLSEAQK